MSINKVILVGNVGKDPLVRYFDKGVAKATFPLATSETFTNQQGENITSTEWHNIVLWRSLAEVAEKTIKKGSQVYIVGKIKTRSYVDKDGVNKYITEILADTLLLLEKKPGVAGNQHPESGRSDNTSRPPSPGSSVNEPGTSYNSGISNNSKNLQGKEYPSPEEQDHDVFGKNDFGSGQNEDDLPF